MSDARSTLPSLERGLGALLPGLALAAAIAALAFIPRALGFALVSPLLVAIFIGMGLRSIFGTPAAAQAGVAFAMRPVLRAGIVLLGFQVTAAQLFAVGFSGFLVIALTLTGTFIFTLYVGRAWGIDRRLAELIAAGTSICGVSAIIATNAITRARDEDAAYAVGSITLFGTLAIFIFPLLQEPLRLGAELYGFWCGAAIHEIAQVVAASFQGGAEAGQMGTVAKLTRVLMLAPTLMAVSFFAVRRAEGSDAGLPRNRLAPPWFVVGFLVLVALNSAVSMPAEARTVVVTFTTFLLTVALAAMGLRTDLRALSRQGLRPLALGLAATLFAAGSSLLLLKLLM